MAWADATPPLLAALEGGHAPGSPIPSSVIEAEEAHLLWRWLCSGDVELLEVSAPLSVPATPVPELEPIEL